MTELRRERTLDVTIADRLLTYPDVHRPRSWMFMVRSEELESPTF